MDQQWKHTYIKEISQAILVAPNRGKRTHKNRPYHGFVFIYGDCEKDYRFDDGRVLHVHKNSLFYLPKGSSYYVDTDHSGECLVINFEADVSDVPFGVTLRNSESTMHNFKKAADAWRNKDDMRVIIAMRAVYDAIYQIDKEIRRQYVSGKQTALLIPALEKIEQCFTENDLSISHLASLCGISEAYFRRLFLNTLGISPKEYILQKRIEYAKVLLRSGDFSITEISALCGYVAPSHFSKEFSKRVGVPPSQFLQGENGSSFPT